MAMNGNGTASKQQPKKDPRPKRDPNVELSLVKTYDYTDESGNLLYQVCRYEPKDFRQRQPDGKGGWKWTMDGVTRTLYRLPDVIKSQTIICAEGEKDCDTMAELGWVATCNVGGAEKWLDAYADLLRGKDIIIIPDNDEKGQKHAKLISESLVDKANSVKIVAMPKPHKDATDYFESFGDKEKAVAGFQSLFDQANHTLPPLPIFSITEMETMYRKFHKSVSTCSLNLGKFLPALGRSVRPIIPGELVVLMASTGVGKTAIAQAIAKTASPLQTLFFELELPTELMFERFAQMEEDCGAEEVEAFYKTFDKPMAHSFDGLKHILVCPESGLTPEKIEGYIGRSALKFGQAPKLVIVDYLGLLKTTTPMKQYERISYCAEQLRVVAKRTKTIVIVTVQVSRPGKKEEGIEVGLYDGKDSGSIENSASLVLGVWRPEFDKLVVKILKNTKGRSGGVVNCEFHGREMRIKEAPAVSDADVPIDAAQGELV